MMEGLDWITPLTTKVELTIPVYNAEFGLHTLVAVNFYFSRSGHIWKEIMPLSCYAEWYRKWYYVIYDIIWVLCLLSLFKTELIEVFGHFYHKENPLQSFYDEYVNFWNVVDWISIVGGLFIVLLALTSFSGTDSVKQKAIKLAQLPTDTDETSPTFGFPVDKQAYAAQAELYVDALEATVHYIHILRLVLSAYPLIIVLRLFKAFKAQPRLALVTKTLQVTGVDLIHFMLVFCSIFLTLCISGFVLFGRRVEMFETFPRAINTVFRMMLGDFDWEAIRVTGYLDGLAWLMVSLCILNLLLLNMILAIVMDGYSEVKKRTVSQDTLFQEIQEIVQMSWNVRQGQWVPLPIIAKAIQEVAAKWKTAELEKAASTVDLSALLNMDNKPKKVFSKFGFRRSSSKLEEKKEDERPDILLGRDSKAEIGMRVTPVDPDIAIFVGAGKIHAVGKGHTKVRVLHEDGNVRDYDIGHDLNFELKLEPDVIPVPFEEGEDPALGDQVISPERLMKIVTTFDKSHKMLRPQAVLLLEKTVRKYYHEHCEDVDWGSLRQMVTKVEYREQKIRSIMKESRNKVQFMSSIDEMKVLRRYMADFYEAVDDDRQRTLTAILATQADVQSLQKRLLMAEENALDNARKDRKQDEIARALADQEAEETRTHTFLGPNPSPVDELLYAIPTTVVDMDSGAIAGTKAATPLYASAGSHSVGDLSTGDGYNDGTISSMNRSSVNDALARIPDSPDRQDTRSQESDVGGSSMDLDFLDNAGRSSLTSFNFDADELARLDAQLGISDATALARSLLRRSTIDGTTLDPLEGWARDSTQDSVLGESVPSFDSDSDVDINPDVGMSDIDCDIESTTAI